MLIYLNLISGSLSEWVQWANIGMMSSNTSPIADPEPSLSNRLANSPQSGEYIPHDLYPIYVHYMYV